MIQKIVLLLIVAVTATMAADFKCLADSAPKIVSEWVDMKSPCVQAMRSQIKKEFDASYQYLQMGAHFSHNTVNRPGFAEFFFKAAKEEREHGSKLIEYLLMRGALTTDVTSLMEPLSGQNTMGLELSTKWESGVAALTKALNLEITVTKSIRQLIKVCESENYNHYHLVDYLTGVYLEEQLKGQRELAGKLSTLQKMMTNHGALGEFLFDKKNM